LKRERHIQLKTRFNIVNALWGFVGAGVYIALWILLPRDLLRLPLIKQLVSYIPLYILFLIALIVTYCMTLYYSDKPVIFTLRKENKENRQYLLQIPVTTIANLCVLFIIFNVYLIMASFLPYANNVFIIYYETVAMFFWAIFIMTMYDLIVLLCVIMGFTIPWDA
jgi:hypothetical protein